MQVKAANILGSKLGREQAVAAKVGAIYGSVLVLGDRLYEVTIQRIFDKLRLFEKIKFVFVMILEIFTMSVGKLKDYVQKSEGQRGFVETEIERFGRYLPTIAQVVIHERDEYMSQTLSEIARIGFGPPPYKGRGRVLAVVGAGHLKGLQKRLREGGVTDSRLQDISTSSKHPQSCWPGVGSLQVVNADSLFSKSTNSIPEGEVIAADDVRGTESN
eukprot:gene1114-1254_t